MYTRNIALIRTLSDGFSEDGGKLSGVVTCEKCGEHLSVTLSLINFAPLTEGKYMCLLYDGVNRIVFEKSFYGNTQVDTSKGFICLIAHCGREVKCIGIAICGKLVCNADMLLQMIKDDLQAVNVPSTNTKSAEAWGNTQVANVSSGNTKSAGTWGKPRTGNTQSTNTKSAGASKNSHNEKSQPTDDENYDDEAIAEVNYYEYGVTDETGRIVLPNKTKTQIGADICPNEKHFDAEKDNQNRQGKTSGAIGNSSPENSENADAFKGATPHGKTNLPFYGDTARGTAHGKTTSDFFEDTARATIDNKSNSPFHGDTAGGTAYGKAHSSFYENIKGEAEKLLSNYPHETQLEQIVASSQWVRIDYGQSRYVFGIVRKDGFIKYICYGVPVRCNSLPPESMRDCAKQIGDYWVLFQSAENGKTLPLTEIT